MLKQRYIIKILVKGQVPAPEIIAKLQQHYGDNALKRTQVYFWIGEVRRGRENLSDVKRLGRSADETLSDLVAGMYGEDPGFSARKIARSLRIATNTVIFHLRNSLGLKCYHRR
jgi:hypothetical protein